MSAVTVTELIVGLGLGFLLAAAVFIVLRRRWIGGGRPLMLCAYRTPADLRWRLGLMRISDDRLDWFSVAGPSPRPERTWGRHELDLGAPVPSREPIPGLPDAITVSGRSASGPVELALVSSAYTAVRAWLESAPPGTGVSNVA